MPRIVGVDDGAVSKNHGSAAFLIAVLLEGARVLDLRIGRIQVDGRNAQNVLVSLLDLLSYDAVMLSGISFGGFNLVDIMQVQLTIGRPVIAIIHDKPNNKAVRDALRKHFLDWKIRWKAVQNAGTLHSCKTIAGEAPLYFEVVGAPVSIAKKMILCSSNVARLPEPVRVARLMARGLYGVIGLPKINEPNLQ